MFGCANSNIFQVRGDVADDMPSIAYYSKVATEEGGKMEGPNHSNGPLAPPPMLKRPWIWGILLCFAIGAGLLLTGTPSPPDVLEVPAASEPSPGGNPPSNPSTLRGSSISLPSQDTASRDSALFEEVMKENAQLRSEVPTQPAYTRIRAHARDYFTGYDAKKQGFAARTWCLRHGFLITLRRECQTPPAVPTPVSNCRVSRYDEKDLWFYPEWSRLAVQTSSGDFDIAAYRAEALAATPPNIIECADADEGGSQDACHLPSVNRSVAMCGK